MIGNETRPKRGMPQSLLEQMQITDFEVRQRKLLFGIDRETETALFSLFVPIRRQLDEIITNFYDEQLAFEEIALLIGDSDTLVRLQSGMRAYVLDLFSGNYDLQYVNSRLRVGLVHKRIGVPPKFYIAAVRILEKTLRAVIMKLRDDGIEAVDETLVAIRKILAFDVSYVMDTYIRSLMSEVESSRREMEDYAESLERKMEERTRELESASHMDSLTQLYNQRAFFDHLRIALANSVRLHEPLCLVYLDIDRFKLVNDESGHQAGDSVLARLGNAIKDSIREMDIGCRYGGDEFCIILPRATAPQAEVVCERIQKHFYVAGEDLSLSIGIAQVGPRHFTDGAELVRRADSLMYRAKKEGRGRITSAVLNEEVAGATDPSQGQEGAKSARGPMLVHGGSLERMAGEN